MKILGIDTSTPVLSVALIENQVVIGHVETGELAGPQLHGEILASLVAKMLAEHQIHKVAVGLGPGPYTGLRTGIAFAQAVAFAREVEIVGVSSLFALAHRYWQLGGSDGVAVLDAKRKEIAWQEFNSNEMLAKPVLTHIDNIRLLAHKSIVGPAFITQPSEFVTVVDSSPPSAVDVAMLCAKGFGTTISPLYLRTPDVTPKEPHA